jgi:hypothetical protein
MANTRIRDMWEPMVKQAIADMGLRTGPVSIRNKLIMLANDMRKRGESVPADYPSPRTIQRIKEDLTTDELIEYQRFSWPESMVQGGLPWEASSAGLELLAFLDVIGVRHRPPVRFVRWFWRVTQAAPNARKDLRVSAAADLARKEALGEPFDRGIEWWMAYMQFPNDEERSNLYKKAHSRPLNDSPIPKMPTHLTASTKDGADMSFWMELIFALGFGVGRVRKQTAEKEATNGNSQG